MAERRKIGKGIIDQYTQNTKVPGQIEARTFGMLIFIVALSGGLIAASWPTSPWLHLRWT